MTLRIQKLCLVALLAGATSIAAQTTAPETLDRAAVEAAVQQALDDYMAAFNNLDIAAWERTFHFPHYRLAGGTMRVLEAAGEQDGAQLRQRLLAAGWHHSAWERREIVHLSQDKAHVDTRFVRYRADGSVLATFDSLYVLTREDGRWGVKLRSSFAP
jgi:PAS domain-containing protein